MIDIEKLAEVHGKRLYNFCIKLTGDSHKAEDLYQDTWEKVIKYQEKYSESYAFESWMFKICMNLYRDYYRKKQLAKNIFNFFSNGELQDFAIGAIAEKSPTAEEAIVKEQQMRYLGLQMDKLSDKYRIPVILYYYNEYSYKQVAEFMGIKEGTIKSRISTAKEKLKEGMVAYERGTI